MSTSTRHLSSAVAAGLLMFMPSFAHAEVSTQGAPEVVHVEVTNASIEEVLSALRDAYGLTWRSNIPLERQISGTYDGPLPQVLGRLLAGNNFVLTRDGNTFHVVIVSSAGQAQTPSALSAMPFPMPPPPPPMPATKASPPPQLPVGLVIPPPGPTTPLPSERERR